MSKVYISNDGVHCDEYGFLDCRDFFNLPWFVSQKKNLEDCLDYYTERNKKDGWTEDMEIEMLSKEVRYD